MDVVVRPGFSQTVARQFRIHPVVGLLGARQVGKTTLARIIARAERQPVHVFDLEDPAAQARLADPRLALAPLEGLVILDEVQRLPDVFSVLRVLVDRPENAARFLVLGSASPDLLRQSADALVSGQALSRTAAPGGSEVNSSDPSRTMSAAWRPSS